MKVSVIDLGYNSLKLVNYDVRNDNTFVAYEQRAVPARLGEGLHESGILLEEPVQRTINGLKLFKDIIALRSVREVLPVATSAVREAGNKSQFLDRVYEETGLRFRVLSEREEAFYSFAGTATSIVMQSRLFFDIGGGSVEIVISVKNSVKKFLSLPMGGLRLTQLFSNASGSFSKKGYSRMRRHILDLLPGRRQMNITHETNLVGVGGTIRALARYDQMRSDYPLNKLHNYVLKRDSVETIHRVVRRTRVKQLERRPEIGQDRAKSIVAGSLVIELMMKKWQFRNLTVSTHGLRDGILAAFLDNPVLYHEGKLKSPIQWVRSHTFPGSFVHAKRFSKALENLGLIDQVERSIVDLASEQLLGGSSLSKPEVLFYTIMNEDSTLSHVDQLLMALSLVRTRNPRGAEWLYLRYGTILHKSDRTTIKRLSVVLRLCEIFERTASTSRLSFGNRKLVIRVIPSPGIFPTELLRSVLTDFRNVFDLDVEHHLSLAVDNQSEIVNVSEA
jgi:exopolyphosphatase/guanosine-5'-triphosphate,3'-diphosphate pyrophosphatase